MQRFVRVHAFGYAGRSVAEDALDCCIIGTGIVEHCGACMAALVGRMVAISRIHDVIKARPKTMIGQGSALRLIGTALLRPASVLLSRMM